MAERSIFCGRLTWPQTEDAARDDKVSPFVPLEQHGAGIAPPEQQARAAS